jgi:hypothetical protein
MGTGISYTTDHQYKISKGFFLLLNTCSFSAMLETEPKSVFVFSMHIISHLSFWNYVMQGSIIFTVEIIAYSNIYYLKLNEKFVIKPKLVKM